MTGGYWWQPWLLALLFGAGGVVLSVICIQAVRRGRFFIGGGRSPVEQGQLPIRFWLYTVLGGIVSLAFLSEALALAWLIVHHNLKSD